MSYVVGPGSEEWPLLLSKFQFKCQTWRRCLPTRIRTDQNDSTLFVPRQLRFAGFAHARLCVHVCARVHVCVGRAAGAQQGGRGKTGALPL